MVETYGFASERTSPMADKLDESLDDDDQRLDEEAQSHQSGEESPQVSETEIVWDDDESADDAPLEADVTPEAAFPEELQPVADLSRESDDDIFRTQVDPVADQVRAEADRLAAERAARREAREAALAPAVVPAPAAPVAVPVGPADQALPVETRVLHLRTTDRFLGSAGLFLFRLALAAIIGVRGVNGLLSPQLAATPWQGNLLPQPQLVGLVLSAAYVGLAILLMFGMLTRLAGFGLAAIAIATLVFVKWGDFSPFLPNELGFVGELELLLAASGVLLLCIGSGAWGVDYGFRRRRLAEAIARRAA